MIPNQSQVHEVLQRFAVSGIGRIQSLGGAGGFSGARLWQIETAGGPLCLRRWPSEHPSRERLAWLHAVLRHVGNNGFSQLPVPRQTSTGESFVSATGHFWELTDWLPGTADFHQFPSRERLRAAMVALAEFHRATRSFDAQTASAPGIASRLQQLRQLDQSRLDKMSSAVAQLDWPEFRQQATIVLQLFCEHKGSALQLLDDPCRLQVTIQPCIRDIWHDHILFTGHEVTGIVDFGAMRIDHVGCDISRLLGSLVGDDQVSWQYGIEAYESICKLEARDLQLITAFDRSTVLLSGMNWVEWVAVERRQFEQPQRIVDRMQNITGRLQHL